MNSRVLAGAFIVFLMISSVFGFVFSYGSTSNALEYGEFTFTPVENQLRTRIDGQEYVFLFFPGDLEFVELSSGVKQLLDAPVLTVTYNPAGNFSEVLADAQYYMEAQLSGTKVIQRALTNSSGTQLMEASCEDASPNSPVVFFGFGDESSIEAMDSCIRVTGVDAYDVYQRMERLVYQSLGVMS